MINVFHISLEEAEKGKKIIEKYYYRHSDNNDSNIIILIFPDDDKRLYEPVSDGIVRYINEYGYNEVVILSSINTDKYYLSVHLAIPIHRYVLNKSEMDAVLRFFSFVVGIPNAILVSLRMPFNQKAELLFDFKDVTVEKVVRHYLLPTFKGGRK